MPPKSPRPSADADPADDLGAGTSPVEDMERADVVNGENTDEEGSAHGTGERQARENREIDPPA